MKIILFVLFLIFPPAIFCAKNTLSCFSDLNYITPEKVMKEMFPTQHSHPNQNSVQCFDPNHVIHDRETILQIIYGLTDLHNRYVLYNLWSKALFYYRERANRAFKLGKLGREKYKKYMQRLIKETYMVAKALDKLGYSTAADMARKDAVAHKTASAIPLE